MHNSGDKISRCRVKALVSISQQFKHSSALQSSEEGEREGIRMKQPSKV
jgi:hypothetical protein